MPLIIIPGESHLDHGLSVAHTEYIVERFKDRAEFIKETMVLPAYLGDLECGLHGPFMGDEPLSDDECYDVVRGGRPYPSRLCMRKPRPTRLLSVIAGPHQGEPCVLYTAFGGPIAEREPGDPSLDGDDVATQRSAVFWEHHALTATRDEVEGLLRSGAISIDGTGRTS